MITSTSTIKNKEKAYHRYDLAKVLNNKAAHVIETTGNYEDGIELFTKALKLNEQKLQLESSQKDQLVPCSCRFRSLESCFVLTEGRKHQNRLSLCLLPSTRMDTIIDDNIDNFIKQELHDTKKRNDNVEHHWATTTISTTTLPLLLPIARNNMSQLTIVPQHPPNTKERKWKKIMMVGLSIKNYFL